MHEDKLLVDLENYITQTILKQVGRRISASEPLITSGLVDSFHLVDLALFIEDNYGVKIEDIELNADTFNSLEELAELIRSRR